MQSGSYSSIVEAADALRKTVVGYLESWEDDVDAGDAVQRPGSFPKSWALFKLAVDATELARDLSDDRAVTTAEAA
jgi:hypothetical protein